MLCALPCLSFEDTRLAPRPVPLLRKQAKKDHTQVTDDWHITVVTKTEDKFIYVNTHTFLSTNLWNLAPETFALLHIQYKITQDSFDSYTLTLEQKLRDGALHI